jgi:hypothetical protein
MYYDRSECNDLPDVCYDEGFFPALKGSLRDCCVITRLGAASHRLD